MNVKKNTKLNFLFLFCLFIISSLLLPKNIFADIIILNGNKKIYGQVLAINDKEIILETISEKNNVLEISAITKSHVIKITDESGTILFNNGKANYKNLNPFYSTMKNNWEELKDKVLSGDKNYIIFNNLEKLTARIVSITDEFIFVEIPQENSDKFTVKKYPLKDIIEINGVDVLHTDLETPKRILLTEIKYPLYRISIGPDYVISHYAQVQQLFQDLYDQNPTTTDKKAAKRKNNFPGIYAQFEIYVKPYLSFGLSAQYYKSEKINTLKSTMADIKYIFHTDLFKPWIALGFAGQDFHSTEIADSKTYEWQNRRGSISIGTGLDFGKEKGFGGTFSIYYIPFGKGKTEIKTKDINTRLTRNIDFSFFRISVGACYSFN